ncbi:hypothetical protein GCM10027290_60740 [Micromonospora sonneratiae]
MGIGQGPTNQLRPDAGVDRYGTRSQAGTPLTYGSARHPPAKSPFVIDRALTRPRVSFKLGSTVEQAEDSNVRTAIGRLGSRLLVPTALLLAFLGLAAVDGGRSDASTTNTASVDLTVRDPLVGGSGIPPRGDDSTICVGRTPALWDNLYPICNRDGSETNGGGLA